ncbi:MAG: alpha/beta hydrolase family protein [Vagococcus sp.]
MKKLGLFSGMLILVSLVGILFYHHNYQMEIDSISTTIEQGKRHIETASPIKEATEKPGLMIFVPDDGAINANDNKQYYPIWEQLAEQNIMSLGWDKAGVGQSDGNWKKQTVAEKEKELAELIHWAVTNLDIDKEKIGVWGIGHAGSYVPKVIENNNTVSFGVLVNPQIDDSISITKITKPTTLMFGTDAHEVDVNRMISTSKSSIPNKQLKVLEFKNTGNDMIKSTLVNDSFKRSIVSLWNPRDLFPSKYLEEVQKTIR